MNTAALMENKGEPDTVNISETLRNQLDPYFTFTPNGSVETKGKAPINMFTLERLKPEFSRDAEGLTPNEKVGPSETFRVG